MIGIKVYVVSTWQAKGSWRRSQFRNFSKLACEHVIDHGVTTRSVRQRVRHPLPITGHKVICRRCTKVARLAEARANLT